MTKRHSWEWKVGHQDNLGNKINGQEACTLGNERGRTRHTFGNERGRPTYTLAWE